MTVNISKRENDLVVSFDYSQERIAKVKSVKGHKWNANEKIWTMPFTEDNLIALKELFKNEQKNIDIENNSRNKELCKLMEEEIKLKGYSFKTKKSYMSHIKRFSSFINKNLDEIGNQDVRHYTLFLLENQNVSHSYVNQAISAIRFLCNDVLRQNKIIELMSRPKKENKLPNVLSFEDVLKILVGCFCPSPRKGGISKLSEKLFKYSIPSYKWATPTNV